MYDMYMRYTKGTMYENNIFCSRLFPFLFLRFVMKNRREKKRAKIHFIHKIKVSQFHKLFVRKQFILCACGCVCVKVISFFARSFFNERDIMAVQLKPM